MKNSHQAKRYIPEREKRDRREGKAMGGERERKGEREERREDRKKDGERDMPRTLQSQTDVNDLGPPSSQFLPSSHQHLDQKGLQPCP